MKKVKRTRDPKLIELCKTLTMSSATADIIPEGWYTLQQIARASGMSISHAGRKARALLENGAAERKLFRIKTAASGIKPVPHYKLTR